MNKEFFANMQSQLDPGPEALETLMERLEAAQVGRRLHWGRYVALAACLVLVIAAIPVGQMGLLADHGQPRLHSYTMMDVSYRPMAEQKDSLDGGGESAALTGSAGQGGEVAVQPGAEAYDRLMEGMGMGEEDSRYPDWYGGAYIGSDGQLTVLLVDGQTPGDKSLELQVLGWTGEGTSFSSAKYSYVYLSELMDRLDRELPTLVEMGGWWANVTENRVDVDLVLPVSEEVLALLAQLDPEGDAIQVNAYAPSDMEFKADVDKVKLGEEPVPGGVDGDPASYDAPKGLIEDLPGEKSQAAHYDLLELPVEEPVGEPDPARTDDIARHEIHDLPEELPGGTYISEPFSGN